MQVKHSVGDTHGRWTLLSRVSGRMNYWRAMCACGSVGEVFIGNLTAGKSTSCGCYSAEAASARATTHGLSVGGGRTKLYAVYSTMLARCYNKKQKSYKNYGARGITVCDRWRFGEGGVQGLLCFVSDMAQTYAEGLQLDRKENNGPYSPDNCHWATQQEQARNKRNVHLVDGVPKTLYAKNVGVCLTTAYKRAKRANTSLIEAINFLKEQNHA